MIGTLSILRDDCECLKILISSRSRDEWTHMRTVCALVRSKGQVPISTSAEQFRTRRVHLRQGTALPKVVFRTVCNPLSLCDWYSYFFSREEQMFLRRSFLELLRPCS